MFKFPRHVYKRLTIGFAPAARPYTLFAGLFLFILFLTYYLFLFDFPKGILRFAPATFSDVTAPYQSRAYAISRSRRPYCPARAWHPERYGPLANVSNVFIAINFYNSVDVLPTFFQELPVLLTHLGPERVYVSVYENSSKDRTPEMLHLLDDMLTALGTPHRVITGDGGQISHHTPGHRISILAGVRNKAIEPLYTGEVALSMPGQKFDELLFMNDIVFCAADILELLYEKRAHGANQVCAVDYNEPIIYDRWVLRAISGRTFYRFEDLMRYSKFFLPFWKSWLAPILPLDPPSRTRFQVHVPLQVFSCWNGAVAFDADVFTGPDGIRFRVSHGELGDDGRPKPVSDKASECFLVNVDMWKSGRGKIAMVPKASVSYKVANYNTYRKDWMNPPPAHIPIEWVREPPAEVAMQDFAVWNVPERWAPWNEQ